MTLVQIQRMKDTETLVLSMGQTFWHYCIIPFLLVVPVLTTIDVFKYYVTHTYSAVRSMKEIISNHKFFSNRNDKEFQLIMGKMKKILMLLMFDYYVTFFWSERQTTIYIN
jgi:hypothetical protein